jgi:hypothetical protein
MVGLLLFLNPSVEDLFEIIFVSQKHFTKYLWY